MKIQEVVDRLYYDMALTELGMMKESSIGSHISYNSMRYLDLIAYRENCTVSYLAGALHISKPAVTMKVNELIRRDMVEKIQSEQDGRVYYLKVRPQVAEEYRGYDEKVKRASLKMEKHFEKEEIELFCNMLEAFSRFYLQEEDHE